MKRALVMAIVLLLTVACIQGEAVTAVTASSTTAPAPSTAASGMSTSTSLPGTTSLPAGGGATLVIRGGPVLTMDTANPVAEAIAVSGNQIVAVGTESEIDRLIGDATSVIELEGRALIPGFVDAHSHFYGRLLEEGLDPDAIQDRMLSVGVTSVGEAGVDSDLLETLRALDDEGRIRVRTSAYLLHIDSCGEEIGDWILDIEPDRAPGERLHVGGVKVFADGGSCNAPAVSYEHGFGGMGDLYLDAADVQGIVRRYGDAGFQVAIHALGDRAVESVMDGLERVIGGTDNPLRHRIEHNAVVRPEMRHRYDEVGAVPVIFGSFGTCAYLGLDERFRFSPPIENQEWEWPWRDLLDVNPETVFAWHADFPIFGESTPVTSLGGFVTRYQELADGTTCEPEPIHLKHAITVAEALEVMTLGSAYALHRDAEVGSIQVGKLADLVVLSADPRAVPPRELLDLQVAMTILDGAIVHCDAGFQSLCGSFGSGGEPETSASLPDQPPDHAMDGSLETSWNAGADAPQWIEIPLGKETAVTRVQMVVNQDPSGPTTHVISGRVASGDLIELARIEGETEMFDELVVETDTPWMVVAIRIETVTSPSWVAWWEIEIETAD